MAKSKRRNRNNSISKLARGFFLSTIGFFCLTTIFLFLPQVKAFAIDVQQSVNSFTTIFGTGQNVLNPSSTPAPIDLTCSGNGGQCRSSCLSDERADSSLTGCPTNVSAGSPHLCCLPKLKFYCQYDSRWQNGGCTISSNGCGPTSLAMILTNFGDTFTPLDVAKDTGLGCRESGSFVDAKNVVFNWVKPKGYKVVDLGSNNNKMDLNTVRTYTGNGYLIFAGACTWIPGNSKLGHSLVITGVTSDNRLRALDPTFKSSTQSCSSSSYYGTRIMDPTYPGKDVFSNCVGRTGTFGGWGYLYAIKK